MSVTLQVCPLNLINQTKFLLCMCILIFVEKMCKTNIYPYIHGVVFGEYIMHVCILWMYRVGKKKRTQNLAPCITLLD